MKLSDQWKGLKSVPDEVVDGTDSPPPATSDPSASPPPVAPRSPPRPLWCIRGLAGRLWADACRELERMGTLQAADARVLSAYVEYTLEFMKLSKAIRRNGLVVETDYGRRVAPEVAARRTIEMSLRALEQDLGFGPASRARMLYSKHGGKPMTESSSMAPAPAPAKVPGRRGGYRKTMERGG